MHAGSSERVSRAANSIGPLGWLQILEGDRVGEPMSQPLPKYATASSFEHSRYMKPDDWVFASRRHRGRKPIWGQAILRKHIRPVAQRVGIQKQFGWHAFRHTYSTLLPSVGTEFKVMQELPRHSSLRSTLDVYTQAISPANPLRKQRFLR
jgi:site-specific recombinase XerD